MSNSSLVAVLGPKSDSANDGTLHDEELRHEKMQVAQVLEDTGLRIVHYQWPILWHCIHTPVKAIKINEVLHVRYKQIPRDECKLR